MTRLVIGLLLILCVYFLMIVSMAKADTQIPVPTPAPRAEYYYNQNESQIKLTIKFTIYNQILAMKNDNWEKAWGYNTEEIKEKLPVFQFRQMVETHYPMLPQAGNISFHEYYHSPDGMFIGQSIWIETEKQINVGTKETPRWSQDFLVAYVFQNVNNKYKIFKVQNMSQSRSKGRST